MRSRLQPLNEHPTSHLLRGTLNHNGECEGREGFGLLNPARIGVRKLWPGTRAKTLLSFTLFILSRRNVVWWHGFNLAICFEVVSRGVLSLAILRVAVAVVKVLLCLVNFNWSFQVHFKRLFHTVWAGRTPLRAFIEYLCGPIEPGLSQMKRWRDWLVNIWNSGARLCLSTVCAQLLGKRRKISNDC